MTPNSPDPRLRGGSATVEHALDRGRLGNPVCDQQLQKDTRLLRIERAGGGEAIGIVLRLTVDQAFVRTAGTDYVQAARALPDPNLYVSLGSATSPRPSACESLFRRGQ